MRLITIFFPKLYEQARIATVGDLSGVYQIIFQSSPYVKNKK
jgi:hypothetical protein